MQKGDLLHSAPLLLDLRSLAPQWKNFDSEGEHISHMDSINNPKYNIETAYQRGTYAIVNL